MDYIRDRVFEDVLQKEDDEEDEDYNFPDHLDNPAGEGKEDGEKMEPGDLYDRLIRDCWENEDGEIEVKVTAEGGQERVISMEQLMGNLYDSGDWDDEEIEDFKEHIEDKV